MALLPIIKAARLIPILARAGFRVIRQVGSHVHLEHVLDRTRKVTIPMHSKTLTKKTLFSILKQAGLTVREFLKMIGKNRPRKNSPAPSLNLHIVWSREAQCKF